jgi:hypothetical protein
MVPSKAASTGEKAHGHGGMIKRQMMGSGAGNTDIPHILKQDPCLFPDGIPMKKGDNMYLQANYNFKGMLVLVHLIHFKLVRFPD